jgi:hypothetical protein
MLRSVDVLAAAQTDRHGSGARRMAGVSEPPLVASARGSLQLFHFAGLWIAFGVACVNASIKRILI